MKICLVLMFSLLCFSLLPQKVFSADSCKIVSITITPGGDYRYDYNVTINGIEPRRLRSGIQVGNDSLYEHGARVCGKAIVFWESFNDNYTINIAVEGKRIWSHSFTNIKTGSQEIDLNSK